MAASSQYAVYFPSFSHQAILFPHFYLLYTKRGRLGAKFDLDHVGDFLSELDVWLEAQLTQKLESVVSTYYWWFNGGVEVGWLLYRKETET